MGSPIGPKDMERIAWVKSFKSGNKWFLKLRKQFGEKLGTQKNYAYALERFCEYMEMDPNAIIETYTKALDQNVRKAVDEWNENLDLFVPWLIDKYGMSRTRAAHTFTAIKSFFGYNVSIKLTTKTPEYHSISKTPVSIDDIREKILPFTDIQRRFIILFLKDSGISQDDVLRLNVGDIEDLGNGFGYIRMFRAKEGIDYETFIGPNTIETMKNYLEFRRQQGFTIDDKSPLFVKKTKLGERLNASLIRWLLHDLAKKVGLSISTHRLRKTFETFLAIGRVHPIILKYWMGHKIRGGKGDIEGKYIIPPKPKQLEAYMEAYKYIDVSPQPDQNEIFLSEVRARMATMSPEDGRRFVKELTTAYRSRAHIIREDPKIKALLKESNITQGGLAFGGHQYEEINETELLKYLRSGWRVTHNLQNGRVIVERH